MPQCNYHEESKGTATCPTCHKFICDKCRMRGTAERCMTCQSSHAKGGSGDKAGREMCQNHATTPADQRCVRCKKVHCPACLNGAMKCFRCALKPEAGDNKGTGSLKGKGGTGSLKGKGGTGMLKRPSVPIWRRQGVSQVLGTVALLGVCFGIMKVAAPAMGLNIPGFGAGGGAKPFTGTAKIEITSPGNGKTLTGNQVIKLKVASSDHVDHVAVTVDGKYWERLKEPPFESEWQTQIFKNGAHTIVAKAVYRGGKKSATAIRKVKTRNRGV